MEGLHFVIIYSVVTIGAICQGSISMGLALIAAPILLMFNPTFVPVPIILSGFVLSLLVIIRDRTALDFSGISIAVGGRIVGTIVALILLLFLSKDIFPIIVGVMILLGVMMSVMKTAWEPAPLTMLIAGFLSGLMGTLAGIGGLPMGLLYQHQKGPVIRGTLAGFILIGTMISFLLLLFAGKCTLYEFMLFVKIFPAILLGFMLSRFTIHVLDKGYTRTAILTVSGLSGIAVIIKSLMTSM